MYAGIFIFLFFGVKYLRITKVSYRYANPPHTHNTHVHRKLVIRIHILFIADFLFAGIVMKERPSRSYNSEQVAWEFYHFVSSGKEFFFFWALILLYSSWSIYTVPTCIHSSVNYQTGVRTYFVPIVRGFEPLPWSYPMDSNAQKIRCQCHACMCSPPDSTEITIDMHRFQFKHAAVGLILWRGWKGVQTFHASAH